MIEQNFRAMVVSEYKDGHFLRQITERSLSDLPEGDLLINVKYSSLNYKDALSASGNKGVTKNYPHTPGIDAAGTVRQSLNPAFKSGDGVIVTGYDLGMNTSGGFSEYIRVPSDWAVPLPAGLTLRESMAYGTAGFTAALAVFRLIEHGLNPDSGEILVTGATGGVGSFAVGILAKEGFKVTAVSGKENVESYLIKLGAVEIMNRNEFTNSTDKLLLKSKWVGAIDTAGGNMLATVLKSISPKGAVIACGNAGSADLNINVYPFILRGISLIGIDSAQTSMDLRRMIWMKIANDWKLEQITKIAKECNLSELNQYIELILKGKIKGRVVVDLND